MLFKKMRITDNALQSIIPIEEECFKGHGWDFDKYRECVDESKSAVLLGAVDQDEVMGCTMAVHCSEHNKGMWHIITLMVPSEYRQKGIAKSLMVLLEEELLKRRTSTMHSMVLEVATSNKVAYNIYKKMGFVKVTTVKDFYPWGEDAHRMVKTYHPDAKTSYAHEDTVH